MGRPRGVRPTPKQLATFRELAQHIATHDQPPSLAELAAPEGVTRHAIACRLEILARLGLITRTPGVARGLRLTEAGADADADAGALQLSERH